MPALADPYHTCQVCQRISMQIARGVRTRQVCDLCGVPACRACSRRVQITGGSARTCLPCGFTGTVLCPCGEYPMFAVTIRCSACDTWECAKHWRHQNCCPDCGPERVGPPSEDSSDQRDGVRSVPPWRAGQGLAAANDHGSSSGSLATAEREMIQSLLQEKITAGWECPVCNKQFAEGNSGWASCKLHLDPAARLTLYNQVADVNCCAEKMSGMSDEDLRKQCQIQHEYSTYPDPGTGSAYRQTFD